MSAYNVTLVVRQIVRGDDVGLFIRKDLKLSFVPTVGMEFRKNDSTWLWDTSDENLLKPRVESVIYDFNEDTFFCLFTVDEVLTSSFWTHLSGDEMRNSFYLTY